MIPGSHRTLPENDVESITAENLPPHKKRKQKSRNDLQEIRPSKQIITPKSSSATVYHPLTPSPDMIGSNSRERIPSIALPPCMTPDRQSPTPPSSPPTATTTSEDLRSPQQYHTPETSHSVATGYNPQQMPIHPHVIIAGPPPAIYYHHQNAFYPPTSMEPNARQQHTMSSESFKGKASDEDTASQNSSNEKTSNEIMAATAASGPSMVPGVPSNMPAFAYLPGQPYSYPAYMVPSGSMSTFPVMPQMSPQLHASITPAPIGGGGRHETTADQREQLRKVSHSAIERRRREKINIKIQQLRQLIPSCADQDHLHKLNILQSAIEYIGYLHNVLGSMESEDGANVLENAARTDHRMLALLQHLHRLSPPMQANQELKAQVQQPMFQEDSQIKTTAKRKRSGEMNKDETAQQGLLMLSEACATDNQKQVATPETKHNDMKVNSLLCNR